MKAREHLLNCLKEEGGVLSNAKAHSSLCNALEKDISRDEYEEIKEQLIGLGLAAKVAAKDRSVLCLTRLPSEILKTLAKKTYSRSTYKYPSNTRRICKLNDHLSRVSSAQAKTSLCRI